VLFKPDTVDVRPTHLFIFYAHPSIKNHHPTQIRCHHRIVLHLWSPKCLFLLIISQHVLHCATHAPFPLLGVTLSVTHLFVLQIQTCAQQHDRQTQHNEKQQNRRVACDERLCRHNERCPVRALIRCTRRPHRRSNRLSVVFVVGAPRRFGHLEVWQSQILEWRSD